MGFLVSCMVGWVSGWLWRPCHPRAHAPNMPPWWGVQGGMGVWCVRWALACRARADARPPLAPCSPDAPLWWPPHGLCGHGAHGGVMSMMVPHHPHGQGPRVLGGLDVVGGLVLAPSHAVGGGARA